MRFSTVAVVLTLLSSSSRLASGADLVPRLVRDIQPTSYAGSSNPRGFAGVDHGFVFTAFGRQLWQYDSREDLIGPVLRKDGMRQLDGSAYAAREPSGKWTLWSVVGNHFSFLRRLRGKPLRSVGFVYPDQSGIVPLLFDADDGSGRALWISNLFTEEGTFEIARPLPLADGKLLRDLTYFRGRLYFVARHKILGTALWVTDGTRAGTSPVFVPTAQGGAPLSIVGVLRGRLLLTMPGTGAELWTSDGTRRGTHPLQEIVRGEASALIVGSVLAANRAFLILDDGRHGRELWATDGTPTGARRLSDFAAADPFAATGLPGAAIGTKLLFFANDGSHGNEPWWSDGTAAGTDLLADLCPGLCSSDGVALAPQGFDTGGLEIFFSAATPALGRELWRTEGTAAGTSLVSDFCAGPCSGDPADIEPLYGLLPVTFTAAVAGGERALWNLDKSSAEPTRLTPPGVTVARGRRLQNTFAAADAEFGDELWTTDGTPESTRMFADLGRELESGSSPLLLGAAGDRLVFTTYFPLQGHRLWSSDGTAEGTFPLPSRGPRLSDGGGGVASAAAGGRLFLAGDLQGGEGRALWAVDGSPSGAVRLTPPGVRVGFQIYPFGDRAIFSAEDLEHGLELWVSEGTPETTHLLVDIVPGPGSPGLGLPSAPLLVAGRLLFACADIGVPLWLTDGTAEGTRPLLEIAPFLQPLADLGFYSGPVEFRGKTYFVTGYNEGQILESDGTAAGTRLWDFPGAPHGVTALYPGASRMFLNVASDDPDAGPEGFKLWATDGTPEGTASVPYAMDFREPDTVPVVVNDHLLFSSGGIYWTTDGSTAGTLPLRDPAGHTIDAFNGRTAAFAGRMVVAAANTNGFGTCYDWTGTGPFAAQIPGVLCGSSFRQVGSRLFFNGFEPHTGAELWALEEK